MNDRFADHGTGSYPCLPHGWQDKKRLKAIHPPFKGPYFCMASSP